MCVVWRTKGGWDFIKYVLVHVDNIVQAKPCSKNGSRAVFVKTEGEKRSR